MGAPRTCSGLRRHHANAGLRVQRGKRTLILVQQLGDPEIEQLNLAIRGYEDVGRFEVAVNDQAPVRIADGIAHRQEELESALHG